MGAPRGNRNASGKHRIIKAAAARVQMKRAKKLNMLHKKRKVKLAAQKRIMARKARNLRAIFQGK